MALRRKNKDDDITHLSGLPGLIHRVVMFFTYPFRHPVRFLIFVLALCAIAYIIPILYGVQPKKVCSWYAELIGNVRSQVSTVQEHKGTDNLVDVDYQPSQQEVRRKMFAAASGQDPRTVDVLRESASEVVDIREVRPTEKVVDEAEFVSEGEEQIVPEEKAEIIVETQKEPEEEVFEFSKHYGEYTNLDYIEKPVEIAGTAKVYNANELSIGDTYIFLYGIYSNPRTERGVKCNVFLRNMVKDEEVRCEILAYTKSDKTATAVCYVGKDEINSLLVRQGLSDRVKAR